MTQERFLILVYFARPQLVRTAHGFFAPPHPVRTGIDHYRILFLRILNITLKSY